MNDDLTVTKVSEFLNWKTIALCVSGGIAAIETPKLARHLRRHGANVYAFTTPSALQFIGEQSLIWGTGNKVVTSLSGDSEHISLQDLVLVAPTTLNTFNKISSGIADNAVTTLVASALGRGTPVYLAPTMHESLYNNPIFKRNLENARQYGLKVIPPRISEGKAKMPNLDYIVSEVCRELSLDPLKGKKLLITAGPTPGKIDDVRMITNRFHGTLGLEMALEAHHRGANVTLLMGRTGIRTPSFLKVITHEDYFGYYDNVFNELRKGYDIGVFSAAVADYIPSSPQSGKIASGGILSSIPLATTKKVIKEVREAFPDLYMVTFKFEIGKTYDQLIEIANGRIKKGYQLVVANRGEEMSSSSHPAYIVGKEGILARPQNKREISKMLMNTLGKHFI